MSERPILCSFIIPAYNEQYDLPLALSSIQKQSVQDFEIIVVDDGSTDRTRDCVREMFPQVTLLTQNHQGTGAARNLGAQAANGEILIFTDADIIFEPDTLQKLIAPILSGQHPATNWFDERVFEPQRPWSQCWQIAHHLPLNSRMPVGYDVTHSRVFRAVRKDYFLAQGGFNTALGIHDDNLSPQPVPMLKDVSVYHINPSNLAEIWATASWIGKGCVAAGGASNGLKKLLFIYCLPKSLVRGLLGAIWHRLPRYFFFKIFFDAAASWGILRAIAGLSSAK